MIGCYNRHRWGFKTQWGYESSGAWSGGYLHLGWWTLYLIRRETYDRSN